ncbi:hypothetical protein [Stenotrophomonas bentonitica]|uniref:hypothetical protein n=1 Tax=Stenotrophomonas bentonitica TaxID=1450134 RepID=UPI00345E1D67
MSNESLAAPERTTVNFVSYFSYIAGTLDWGSPQWCTLEKHLNAIQEPFESLTMGAVLRAISATRDVHPELPVTFVNRLLGPDDVSRKELFSVIRRLLRVFDLSVVELLALVDILDRCPGSVEDLSVRNLLGLISIVDIAAIPRTPDPVAEAIKAASDCVH